MTFSVDFTESSRKRRGSAIGLLGIVSFVVLGSSESITTADVAGNGSAGVAAVQSGIGDAATNAAKEQRSVTLSFVILNLCANFNLTELVV